MMNDYVLRIYPRSKVSSDPPSKYMAYWRGPYRIVGILDANQYEVQNLVSMAVSRVHVKQLKDFYYDPKRTIPLNIAVKDTDEFVVEDIINHALDANGQMMWKVRWEWFEEDKDTWEPLHNLVNVGKFNDYCSLHPKMKKYIPKEHRK